MGYYSLNRTNLGTYSGEEIVANENYYGGVGAATIMIESVENDLAMFNGQIMCDFQEATILQEGAVDKLEVMYEANLGGFVDKIKQYVKKVWEKIKGLFHSFITRVEALVTRDNKKFAEKFKKEVFSGKDYSKMKYKYAKPKNKFDQGVLKSARADQYIADLTASALASESSLETLEKAVEDDDFSDNALSDVSGIKTTHGEFKKDFFEHMFEDNSEEEGIDESLLTRMYNILVDSSKSLKGLKDDNTAVDKAFAAVLSKIDKARNLISKDMPYDKDKDKDEDKTAEKLHAGGEDIKYKKSTAQDTNKRLNLLYKTISVTQGAITKVASEYMTCIKFDISQCRRVYGQAAAYNPKSVKENAIFIEAVGDAEQYEAESLFD